MSRGKGAPIAYRGGVPIEVPVSSDHVRRAFLVDLTKTKVVTADDFPTPEEGGSSGFRENFKGRYGRDDS